MDLTRAARRAPWIAAGAVLVTAVAGGAGLGWSAKVVEAAQRPPLAADADARTAAERLGACPTPDEDPSTPAQVLSAVDHWLEVTGFARAQDRAESWPGREPVEVDLRVRDLDRPSRPAFVQPVRVLGDQVAGVDWALRSASRAFLALDAAAADAAAGDAAGRARPERVSYVLVRHRAGPHFFAGTCASTVLTNPLRRMLPTRYDAAMAGLVGLRSAEVVPALLRAQRDEVTGSRHRLGRG